MLPARDSSGRFTSYEIVVLTIGLLGVTILPFLLRYEGTIYLAGAVLGGALFLRESARMLSDRSLGTARRLLHASVMYLPLIFALMVIDKIRW
jgi:protoheme IX farnesyltransferase